MGLFTVPLLDEGEHGRYELVGIVENAVAQNATGHDSEPQLHLVQPGTVGRRVVKNEALPVSSVPLRDELSQS